MNVTFAKTGARRYSVHVERDRAPALWIRSAPGYDDYLPHDVLHFVAEAEFGLDGAVFGDLAAGGNARTFVPVDKALVAKMWRKQRTHRHRLPDGRRSELLADVLEAAWNARRGVRRLPADWCGRLSAAGTDEAKVEALVPLLDDLAARWHALQVGGSTALTWPRPEGRRHPATRAARDKPGAPRASAEAPARSRARSAGPSTRDAARGGRAPQS
jgi:hypothetical protein